MAKCVDYRELVKNKECWIPDSQLSHIPGVILKEYKMLSESIENDDVCGALFRLKDIYETSMKQPAILAIISISSYIEDDNDFIRMTSDELKKEHEKYISNQSVANIESEALQKFGLVLSRLLREPLSIGSWKELIEIIIEHSTVFEIDDSLKMILLRTLRLLNVKPKKVNGEKGRYEDVSNWRNKTIGHGTLLINTDDYWEQVYDLLQGLQDYFIGEEGELPLSDFYREISIERDENSGQELLTVGKKKYSISEFIYNLEDEQYFFDSYYSRQRYTEITNYVNAPIRLRNSAYYQTLYSLFSATKKNGTRKKGRQISNSAEREMYSCLKSIPIYEKPEFVISEIIDFMDQNNKGIIYIQMERGMGKSTLAHKLDGRYQNELLQKDLKAVVRVYHISDMLLRGENRKRDYFTALNNNLISYNGGQLEVDNEEYYVEGRDLRQLMEGDDETASLAFCQYLELFRIRYEDELEEFDEDEVRLVYIIDGIDELNSDTFSILNTIPNGRKMQSISDELANNIYVVLLSRTKEEDDLPLIAKESIKVCEEKSNVVFKVNNESEMYYQLLEKYIKRNFKGISKENISDIIENAQRKFLYIQPYMAMGESVLTPGVKISAYDVARNYINELQKLYCGTSLHILQLIISSIALFHVISLKKICNLILFTEVSYDVIGVLNDILPLMTTKRTDGEDMYGFANEEYEKYVYENMHNSVCEAICRYRISLTSWFESVNKKDSSYGKQWGDYVRRALVVDRVAQKENFCETTEDYVKSLIYLWCENDPGTFYSRVVGEELQCNIINQIRQLKYKELELLSVKDLSRIDLIFRSRDEWSRESSRLKYEYTQEIIQHCIEKEEVDQWFELIISERMGLKYDLSFESHRLETFGNIVGQWSNYENVVDYLNALVQDDLKDERVSSYGAYLEQLLLFINEDKLRSKIFEALLNTYFLLANSIVMNPRNREIDIGRKEIMSKNLNEAERYHNLENFDLIDKIKEVVFEENTYDNAIAQLEMLAEKLCYMDLNEYSQELFRVSLKEENLSEEQIKRYRQAQIKNYRNMMDHMKSIFDGHSVDSICKWLNECWIGNVNCFSTENKDLLIEYLNLYEKVIMLLDEEKNMKGIRDLTWAFKVFLKYYDENIRETPIGLYRTSYWDVTVDDRQKMTSWEKTYALCCSSLNDIDIRDLSDVIPTIANDFTSKYLQDLYDDGEFEQYNKLNDRIMKGFDAVDFREKHILECEYPQYRSILYYYRWLSVRYFRSVEGKDELTSGELYERLKEEYAALSDRVIEILSNESDLIHKENMLSEVRLLFRVLLSLSKMIPDSISTVDLTKKRMTSSLDDLVKNATSKAEIKELVEKMNDIISDPSEWYNADIEFLINMADKSIFQRFYDKPNEIKIPEQLME